MILDANIAVYWSTGHPHFPTAEIYLERHDLVAPELLRLEVANALLGEVRRGSISIDHATAGVALAEKAISTFIKDAELIRPAMNLAIRHNHAIYDCLYLALALERREPLATADRRMAALAAELDIETQLIEPSP